MRFNKDIAKLIGAHDYHKVETSKIGTQFLVVPDFTKFIWDGVKQKWWRRATYYLPLEKNQVSKDLEVLMSFKQKKQELENDLEKISTSIKEYEKIIYSQITANSYEIGVLFIHRQKRDGKIEKESFWKNIIRKGDELISFGIRYERDGEDVLYIAVIKYNGLIDHDSIGHYFSKLSFKGKSYYNKSGSNSVTTKNIKQTGFKIETLWDSIEVMLPVSARDAARIKNAEKDAAILLAEKEAEVRRKIAIKEAKAKLAMYPPTAKIFAYKGTLAAEIDMKNGKFLNNPKKEMGCVINTKDIAITPQAVALIKRAGRQGGSFAEIMLTKHADGSGSSIGLMGSGKVSFGHMFSIGRDCDTSVLNDCFICELEIPDDYQKHIDSNRS